MQTNEQTTQHHVLLFSFIVTQRKQVSCSATAPTVGSIGYQIAAAGIHWSDLYDSVLGTLLGLVTCPINNYCRSVP